jgi:hypothetical protein
MRVLVVGWVEHREAQRTRLWVTDSLRRGSLSAGLGLAMLGFAAAQLNPTYALRLASAQPSSRVQIAISGHERQRR